MKEPMSSLLECSDGPIRMNTRNHAQLQARLLAMLCVALVLSQDLLVDIDVRNWLKAQNTISLEADFTQACPFMIIFSKIAIGTSGVFIDSTMTITAQITVYVYNNHVIHIEFH